MILKHGDYYVNKETHHTYRLNEDYNGLWYLDLRNSQGYHKSRSYNYLKMVEVLKEYWVKSELF